MLDNLRRTSSPPASVARCWRMAAAAGRALIWTAFVVSTIALPTVLPSRSDRARRAGINARSHLRALARDAALAARSLRSDLLLAHQRG